MPGQTTERQCSTVEERWIRPSCLDCTLPGERRDLDTLEAPRPLARSALRARASSLYAAVFLDRGRSRKRIQAKIMLGSSYMARPTWLYLPGGILVLKDR